MTRVLIVDIHLDTHGKRQAKRYTFACRQLEEEMFGVCPEACDPVSDTNAARGTACADGLERYAADAERQVAGGANENLPKINMKRHGLRPTRGC